MQKSLIEQLEAEPTRDAKTTLELNRAYARIAYLEAKMEAIETLLDGIVDAQYTHAQKNGVVLAAANFLRKAREGFHFTQASSNELPF